MTTTIGTWNVENLFRPGGSFGPRDEATYSAKLTALVRTINRAELDVLGLQEVGDPDALADLIALLPGDWHVAVSKRFNADHPIRTAVISRRPLQIVADIVDYAAGLDPIQVNDAGPASGRASRGALVVRLPSLATTIVCCHLKSKLLSYPGGRFFPRNEGERARYAAFALYQRTAEAVTVRVLANKLLDGRPRRLVVLGDLNDEPHAATTQILSGPPGSELGTPGAEQPDKGDKWRLWNLAPLLPEKERFSRIHRGRGELIDHILVSHALLDRVDEVRAVHDQQLTSVDEDPTPRRDATASDHAPILARLTLP